MLRFLCRCLRVCYLAGPLIKDLTCTQNALVAQALRTEAFARNPDLLKNMRFSDLCTSVKVFTMFAGDNKSRSCLFD